MLDKTSIHTIPENSHEPRAGEIQKLQQKHVLDTIKTWKEIKSSFIDSHDETPGMSDTKNTILNTIGNTGIQSENIIAIPWHYKEETHRILQVIERMEGDFVVIIYFNGAQLEDKEEFNIRYNDLSRILERDKLHDKVILVKHIYEKRVPLGTIRSDMIEGLIRATSDSVNDPVVYGFDADTYDISPGYIPFSRRKFDGDSEINFLRSQLRWTNGVDDGYTWLSEIMMHLAILAKNRSHIVSMGAATSFRLRGYIGIGGYDRHTDMGEDIQLGKQMKEQNEKSGKKFGGKIYVDPRRGIQSIHEGKRFQDQWSGMKQYDFVEKDTIFSNDMILGLTNIIQDLIGGNEVNEIDLNQFSGHLDGRYFVGRYKKRIQQLFLKFWNINTKHSLYRASLNEHGKIMFTKKEQAS